MINLLLRRAKNSIKFGFSPEQNGTGRKVYTASIVVSNGAGYEMENYEGQLLSITAEEMSVPKGAISFSDLSAMISIQTAGEYERELRKLAKKLPYKTSSWPVFGEYIEDWYRVEVGEFKYQLQYCERGGCKVRADCENIIDLSYQIQRIVSPRLTLSASKVAEILDKINDHRLLIWLRKSSEIFHMYQVNKCFGSRILYANVTWMSEELVRMGAFESAWAAFRSERHIVQGLSLSGLPKSMALMFYQELLHG